MPAAYPREFREDVVRKDAFCGRIVGYSMDSRMKARLAVNALVNAATPTARRPRTPQCAAASPAQ